MGNETLIVEKAGHTALVTLNRPARRNAINEQMLEDLGRLFAELRRDEETRFVIITAAGPVFSAGVDITELASKIGSYSARLGQHQGHEVISALENLEQVTVAAIHGHCLGAGLVIAMGCDFRIASTRARFGVPEANLGLFFTWGSTPRLVSLVGRSAAKRLIMTCDSITGDEALRIGLVDEVVEPEQLSAAARRLVDKITAKSPLAIRLTKKLVNAAAPPNFGDLYLAEPELVERVTLSPDLGKGLNAFKEKSPTVFTER